MKHVLSAIVVLVVVSLVLYVVLHDEATAPELPSTPQATTTSVNEVPKTPVIPEDVANHIASKADKITVTTPAPYAQISSPVTITGKARGMWFFEASFQIVITDWDGRIIGSGLATPTSEHWMTEAFVPFSATVTFTADPNAYSDRGTIILKRDNPSGLPQNDDALEIPVILN